MVMTSSEKRAGVQVAKKELTEKKKIVFRRGFNLYMKTKGRKVEESAYYLLKGKAKKAGERQTNEHQYVTILGATSEEKTRPFLIKPPFLLNWRKELLKPFAKGLEVRAESV